MRYSDIDEQRLKQTVSAFNKKVRKLEKAGQVAPEKISLGKIRKEITETRQDFNRELKRLERFQKETAAKPHTFKEYGVTVTHWEAVEVSRQIAINNRKREKLRNEMQTIEITLHGKPVLGADGKPLVRAQMQGPEQNAMKPKIVNLNKTNSKSAFRALQESVKKEGMKKSWTKREEQWQKNYLKALNKEYRGKQGKEIRDKIKGMKPDEFAKIMRKEQNANITFQYSVMEKKSKLKELKNIWVPEKTTEKIPIKN